MQARASGPDAPYEAWRFVAERKIQEWLDAGGADNLPGRGKPLNLEENPFLKQEYRLAFKILENADMAPDWIGLGNDIEASLSRLREMVRIYHHSLRSDHIRLRAASFESARAIEQRVEKRKETFATEYREQIVAVNRLIDRFNVAVPVMMLGRVRLDVATELDRAFRGEINRPE
jgi:DnaJ homolog subfamily C member 28